MLGASGRAAESAPLLSGAEAKLAPFFAGRDPGWAARLSRARLLAALGRDAEATALLSGAGTREDGGAPRLLARDLSLGSLVMAF